MGAETGVSARARATRTRLTSLSVGRHETCPTVTAGSTHGESGHASFPRDIQSRGHHESYSAMRGFRCIITGVRHLAGCPLQQVALYVSGACGRADYARWRLRVRVSSTVQGSVLTRRPPPGSRRSPSRSALRYVSSRPRGARAPRTHGAGCPRARCIRGAARPLDRRARRAFARPPAAAGLPASLRPGSGGGHVELAELVLMQHEGGHERFGRAPHRALALQAANLRGRQLASE
jgi:hypothetical protein